MLLCFILFFCTFHWADLSWLTFHYLLYPVWLCMWQIIKNLEPWTLNLTGEAQLAAQQLPVQNLLVYDDLKRAILQRVRRSPEQHRQRFRSLELGPFVMAHQLRDACRRWLLAGEGGVDYVIDQVVLEQFIARLPKGRDDVQHHWEGVFGDPVGGPHPPLLSPGMGIHPLFGPRTLAVAPTHEGYQRADHPLVSGITALQIQGDPQAGDADDWSRLPLQEWGGGGCRPEGFPAWVGRWGYVARGAWFSKVCSGRKTQETAVSKWVKCKMRITCVWLQ